MVHKFEPKNSGRLHSEERKKRLPARKTLQSLGMRPGMLVADIGCGNGYFAVEASRIVTDKGKVFAFDISEPMLEDLRERIRKEGIGNIEVRLSKENALPAEDAWAHFALLSLVLHEAKDPSAFIAEAKRILKKDGSIALIEWDAQATGFGPPQQRRMQKQEAASIMVARGFHKIELGHIGRDFYTITGLK